MLYQFPTCGKGIGLKFQALQPPEFLVEKFEDEKSRIEKFRVEKSRVDKSEVEMACNLWVQLLN